jgi:hypothetical protein
MDCLHFAAGGWSLASGPEVSEIVVDTSPRVKLVVLGGRRSINGIPPTEGAS